MQNEEQATATRQGTVEFLPFSDVARRPKQTSCHQVEISMNLHDIPGMRRAVTLAYCDVVPCMARSELITLVI